MAHKIFFSMVILFIIMFALGLIGAGVMMIGDIWGNWQNWNMPIFEKIVGTVIMGSIMFGILIGVIAAIWAITSEEILD